MSTIVRLPKEGTDAGKWISLANSNPDAAKQMWADLPLEEKRQMANQESVKIQLTALGLPDPSPSAPPEGARRKTRSKSRRGGKKTKKVMRKKGKKSQSRRR